MRYLVLALEELSNYVERRALQTKDTGPLCRFILEDIICRYRNIRQIRHDIGEFNVEKAPCLLGRLGTKLRQTTSMNPEANEKIEQGHTPIVQALVKACSG